MQNIEIKKDAELFESIKKKYSLEFINFEMKKLSKSAAQDLEDRLWIDFKEGLLTFSCFRYAQRIDYCFDFCSKPFQKRLESRVKEKDLLIKAVGKAGNVLDATAGWCRDAMLLAAKNYNVTAVERHPLVYLALKSALFNIPENNHFYQKRVLKNFNLIYQEAYQYVGGLESEFFDVIYFDPMFHNKKKQASVKKDLIVLRQVMRSCPIRSEMNDLEFLELARKKAVKRVVVKRAKNAEPIKNDVSFQIVGKAHRFDIYLC